MLSNIKFFEEKNYIFLLLFFPLALLIGIAVAEVLATLSIFYYLLNSKNKINELKDIKIIFLLFLSLYFALNALIQINDSLRYSPLFFFRFVLFSMSTVFIFNLIDKKKTTSFKNKLLKIIIFFVIIILIDSVIQFVFGKNMFGYEIIGNRISSFFKDELILGSFLIRILPILIYLIFFFNYDLKKNYLFLLFFFILYFFSIYISAGRSSFTMMLIFILLSIIFTKKLRKIFLHSLSYLIVIIIITSLFELGKTNPSNRLFVKTFNQFTNQIFVKKKLSPAGILEIDTESPKNKEEVLRNIKIFSFNHHGHIQLAYELYKKNKIFGIGPRGFRYYCKSVNFDPEIGVCSNHPHNYLIQILSETGLIGTFLYFFAFLFVLFKILKCLSLNISSNKKDEFLILSFGLIIYFLPFLPSGNFFNNWLSLLNFYLIGIYFFSYKRIFEL
tara:strand:+ start:585 stop:1916 length:1332 start_codon:yes stop_codon:yes gene_type:complete